MELCEWQSVLWKQVDGSKWNISLSACLQTTTLVTEDPQTSSSWRIWNMEDYRCQTIFFYHIIYNINATFLWLLSDTVKVSCRNPSLFSFLLNILQMFLDLQIFLPPQLLYDHSKDLTSGLYCMNNALDSSSHILTFAFLRRHVRACSCVCICHSPHTDENLPSCIPLWTRSTLKQ